MTKIFLPPKKFDHSSKPLIFLAGPIQGAGDWQKEAIEIIGKLNPRLNVANPRMEYLPGTFSYPAQVDWETYHLRKAGKNGVILFWLAKEAKHDCERAFAQTTRFELAEWKMRHERDDVKLVVGVEEGFSGARYIKRRFGQDCPDVPVCSSLEEACRLAVEAISRP